MPSKGMAARPQPPAAAARKPMHKVDRLRTFDAQLGKLKACNRADFLNAWRERKSHAKVSRFMGSKASRRPLSAPVLRFPDGKPIDEDAPPDSDSEDDCPPHQNARRLDALDRINGSELLHTLCSWMYEIRRRHSCKVRASDFDITNGVMLLETLYILMPHLFGEAASDGRAPALAELNSEYDPASPPSSRPASTNAAGIDPNVPISVACGVERDLDRNGDVARRNMDRVIEVMGRHVFYDYYGSGLRTDQINFTAARKSDNIVWLLPKSLFTMAHHGPNRDKIMVEVDFLGDEQNALLFDEMNQVLLKIGAQKAPEWRTVPKIVPDAEDPTDYSWLNMPAPVKSQALRQDSIPILPEVDVSPARRKAEEDMKARAEMEAAEEAKNAEEAPKQRERSELAQALAEVSKKFEDATKRRDRTHLGQPPKEVAHAEEKSGSNAAGASTKADDSAMERTASHPIEPQKTPDEEPSKVIRKRNTIVGPPRRVPKRVSRQPTDSEHVLGEKSARSLPGKPSSHEEGESNEDPKEEVTDDGARKDRGEREKQSDSAPTRTNCTDERTADKAPGENSRIVLSAPASGDDSSTDAFGDDDDDDDLGSPEQERSVSVDGEKGADSVRLIDEPLLAELQLSQQGSGSLGPQVQRVGSRITDGSSENSALPNLAHTFVSPSLVRARGIGQLSVSSTPIGSRTLSRSSTKPSLARGSSASNLRLSAEFSRGERLSAQLQVLHKQVEDERTVRAALEAKIEIMEKEKEQIDRHSGHLHRLMERLTQQREEAVVETKRLRVQLDRMERRTRQQDERDRQFEAMQEELQYLRARDQTSTQERQVLREEVDSLRAMLHAAGGETLAHRHQQRSALPNGHGRKQSNNTNTRADAELNLGRALAAEHGNRLHGGARADDALL